ncbi:MAG TPA: CHAT domain-containing tetratricopeptide repeat protein [Candidatus Cryosericum sp.]|nr:CHAT domain-containing tetratricopeptide repeat protein [Candidatus Cryosericum sp.]
MKPPRGAIHAGAALLLGFMAWAIASGPAATEPSSGSAVDSSAPVARDDLESLIKDGRYAAAEAKARAMLAEAEKHQGPSSLQAAEAIDWIVEALWRDGRGNQPEARTLAERAVAIRDKSPGPRTPGEARSLRNLGKVLERSGDAKAARQVLEKVLAIQEHALGPQHPDVARALIDLGNLFVNAGKDASAAPLYERALAIQQQAPGQQGAAVSRTLHNLALLHYRAGDYALAESEFERTLTLKQAAFGPDHLEVAWTLNALGVVERDMGDYQRARALYEHALSIREATLGPDHIQVGWVLNNLGFLLRSTGDYSEAVSCFERALSIKERALGPQDVDVAMTLKNLGDAYHLTGALQDSRVQYERALAIWAKQESPSRAAMAETLEALASVLADMGDRERARALYDQALETWRLATGPTHPDIALGLQGLAMLRFAESDAEGARPLLEEAIRIREKAFGPDHPLVGESLDGLGKVLAIQDGGRQALDVALRAEAIGRNHLRLTARSLSDREALRYAAVRPSGLDTALFLASKGLGPAGRRRVWDALIRSRALVLDEMARRKRLASKSGDPDLGRLAVEVASSSRTLANLTTQGPDPEHPEAYRGTLEAARQAKERAERALAERSAPFGREQARDLVGFKEVSAGLPPGSALLAYAVQKGPVPGAASYLAFVLRAGTADPDLVVLGPAASIDSLVARWVEEAGRSPEVTGDSALQAEASARTAGAALRVVIWDPLLPLLGQAKRLFVVDEGSLQLVSLAGLPSGNSGYLVETGPVIHYLTSERDLVAVPEHRSRGEGLLALGGPAFDRVAAAPGAGGAADAPEGAAPAALKATSGLRGNGIACPDLHSIRFTELPASAREIDTVVSLWKNMDRHRSDAIQLTGSEASEAAFKSLASGRRILHLATHGFFLGRDCRAGAAGLRGMGGLWLGQTASPSVATDPLLLSGLALAGANLRRPSVPDGEDGILTAEEIAAMDLGGVEWAVLSACDTGAGVLAAGEGVLGLRRSFEVAGVATVIMSLWPVEDEAALGWMRALYEARLVRGLPTPEAARAASLDVLRVRRQAGQATHPFYWAGFVATGDWR